MQNQSDHKPPAPKRAPRLAIPGRLKLPLIIAGGIIGVLVVALVVVNVLISAEWVRDRVAARIKEQTGRELTVNGSTTLLFTPGPYVVITDAMITDPAARAGTADLSVGRLAIDLNFSDLLSRRIDAERIVLVRPVLTLRLGSDPMQRSDAGEKPKPRRFAKAAASGDDDEPRREIKLKDVRIEDGTVNIVYDEKGTEKRVEHIAANLSLPTLTDPFTGTGKFDWKEQTVNFSFELTTPADLRDKRPARLLLALDTPAIAARFDGNILTRPSLSGQGELSAKAHSIPSLLAWMRERPAASTAIGDGELASHVAWTKDEISFSNARFALEHASGQGQAVVTLHSPRPHIRAALALDHLDLNPFMAKSAPPAGETPKVERSAPEQPAEASPPAESTVPRKAPKDWFSKPDMAQGETSSAEPDSAVTGSAAPKTAGPEGAPSEVGAAPPEPQAAPPRTALVSPVPAPVAQPAAFDADVNLNVRKTRVAHLDLGPTSLGLNFRDGVLSATLGGMDLYDGHASGNLVFDAAKPVPAFTGNFRLDGVQARPLLSDAAQFSMLSGQTKLDLKISGAGSTAEAIKSSLSGEGNVAISEGAIEGIDITEFISSIGAGQIPDMRQGPGAKTTFSDLGGSFTISNGLAETNNLKMISPLLNVRAEGTVDLARSTLDILAHPEIVAGPKGKGGANDLAGLTVPVRIEGPLDGPRIKPEIKGMFANPEQTGKTVNQIGEALQKKFKGKPVGEAIGRFLGNVQIGGPRDRGEGGPPAKQSGRAQSQGAAPPPKAGEPEQGDADEPITDPDLEEILR